MEPYDLPLVAYNVNRSMPLGLATAPAQRAWMEATNQRFANRCLPLLIANQAGWFVLSSHTVRVVWTGGDELTSVQLDYLSGAPPYPSLSHFGHGLLTWNLPYLFRTPPGYNLLVRGPANLPKDGIYPLEGIVEADWTMATFTMNWKLTRADLPITFEAGEPICMLVPQRRGELELFKPTVHNIEANPTTQVGYREWCRGRAQFLTELQVPDSEAARRAWQKDYFQGLSVDGSITPGHQTKLKLREFVEAGDDEVAPPQRRDHRSAPPAAAPNTAGMPTVRLQAYEPAPESDQTHPASPWTTPVRTLFATALGLVSGLVHLLRSNGQRR